MEKSGEEYQLKQTIYLFGPTPSAITISPLTQSRIDYGVRISS